ncbi:hypothetical protein B5P45_11815 [Phyllobacterium zundukense]|uniref:Uncharacterized protein n=1 Tax=Phyllobacterium zundukense TaxID=1867719 RepID=A0A2N9VYI9_9HYPH|nr:hypothetical protein BLM14_25685 [Phyllobacterium zundukense]PIO44557.1 hypothetical protein B5P45_11815 [Phyllobacterium zundukense]
MPWDTNRIELADEQIQAQEVLDFGVCSEPQPADKPSFENADNIRFFIESDWFLEFNNHSLKHIGMSDFQ